jgi:hypothetical protein
LHSRRQSAEYDALRLVAFGCLRPVR